MRPTISFSTVSLNAHPNNNITTTTINTFPTSGTRLITSLIYSALTGEVRNDTSFLGITQSSIETGVDNAPAPMVADATTS